MGLLEIRELVHQGHGTLAPNLRWGTAVRFEGKGNLSSLGAGASHDLVKIPLSSAEYIEESALHYKSLGDICK